MKKRIKINGIIIFVCAMLVIAFPMKFLRLHTGRLDLLAEICGMCLMLLGMLLRISSRGFKSEHSEAGKTLVTGGPYGLVRNPMYLGISCIALGLIMIIFQSWALITFAAFFIFRYITLIFKEEKILADSFGQQYLDYQKRVPRILPRPGAVLRSGLLEYLSLRPAWIKKEINSILPLLIIVYGFALWRGAYHFLLMLGLTLIFAASAGVFKKP